MNKFRNNSGSRKRGGPERSSSDREEGKKSKSYKAKRSFTKNKSFREGQQRRSSDKEGAEFKPKYRSGGFSDRERGSKSQKPGFGTKRRSEEREEKSFGKKTYGKSRDRDEKPERAKRYSDSDSGERKSFDRERRDDKKPFGKSRAREGKPSWKSDEKPERAKRYSDSDSGERKSFSRDRRDDKKPFGKSRDRHEKKTWGSDDRPERSKRYKHDEFEEGRAFSKHKTEAKKPQKKTNDDGLIRLNKYLSNAGIASRREADNLILGGTVKVNGVVVDQLGYKIKPTDKVTYGDASVKTERKIYLLLNKPKDYITTMDDPRERKTVMELIEGACRERIYPVGRLDRNTTGLLLFTNDGELTTKLTHPKHGIKKVYHVSLNKGLKPDDFRAIIDGIELEDGPIKADDLAFVGEGKKEVGIEVHSGRNRIVRRIFEHLGYDVLKLDRVVFAGLTKKDLPRGKYRFLSPKEVSFLQMIG